MVIATIRTGSVAYLAAISHRHVPTQHAKDPAMKTLPLFALSVVVCLAAVGCGEKNAAGEGPVERAGKATDKAVDKTSEVIKEGAKKTGEAVEKAGEKIKDATK